VNCTPAPRGPTPVTEPRWSDGLLEAGFGGPATADVLSWRTRAATVRADGMAAVVELVLSRFFSPAFRASEGLAVARLEATLRAASVDGYAGSCDVLADADLRDLAPQVQARSLVIVGTADEAAPPADARALHALLPDAELVELPGAGHLANLEQPDRFETLVLAFLIGDDQEILRA
jgi:pimeloyl-ACP methyl ester carboxylesterase